MLNLAKHPYVNNRPVVRVSIALWVLAAISCGASLILYWNYFTSQGENAETLRKTNIEIEREFAETEELLVRLEGMDLKFQGRENEALNQRIAQRVFSWSSLFDRVAEVLPPAVSLDRIAPDVTVLVKALDAGPQTQAGSTIVELGISGTARNDVALLQLVDRFFEHPNFTRPNLSSERRGAGRELEFSMTVSFLPELEAFPLEGQPKSESGFTSVPEGVERSAGNDRSDGPNGSDDVDQSAGDQN